ncbi:MAG: GtrA family protein [Alphaproteobacteria bacterium]
MLKNLINIPLNTEVLRYLVAGATTTLLNILLYTVLILFGLQYTYANLIALITSKIYAFFINKYYVYKHKSQTGKDLLTEIAKFTLVRGFTGIFDYFSVMVLIEILSFNKLVAKYIIVLIVIILNYILGKKYVFRLKN